MYYRLVSNGLLLRRLLETFKIKGNHKGLPLRNMMICRGNPLWLPLIKILNLMAPLVTEKQGEVDT